MQNVYCLNFLHRAGSLPSLGHHRPFFPTCSSEVAPGIRLSQVCPPGPPADGPISSSSLKIIVTRTAALAVACLTWPPRSPARSHGQVEPAVCGGQGQTLRQRRWEVRHSSVNREVSVINIPAFCQRRGTVHPRARAGLFSHSDRRQRCHQYRWTSFCCHT